jgi:Spy/CpxP family protein refolding chaperone
MTSKIILAVVITAAVTAGIIFGAQAFRHYYYERHFWGRPEKRAEYLVGKITKKLDLNAVQQEKLERIKTEILAKTKNFRKEGDSLRKEMRSLFTSDKLTKGMVDKFLKERRAKIDELRPFFVDKIIEFHNMLTPAQRGKFAGMIERWYHRFRR